MKLDCQGRIRVLKDLAELAVLPESDQVLIGYDGIDLIIVPSNTRDFSYVPIVAIAKMDNKFRFFAKSILADLNITSTEYYISFIDGFLRVRFTN